MSNLRHQTVFWPKFNCWELYYFSKQLFYPNLKVQHYTLSLSTPSYDFAPSGGLVKNVTDELMNMGKVVKHTQTHRLTVFLGRILSTCISCKNPCCNVVSGTVTLVDPVQHQHQFKQTHKHCGVFQSYIILAIG